MITSPITQPITAPITQSISTTTGGSSYTPASTFATVAGAWFYGWDNTDLKVNSDGTGGSVADGGTVGRWNDRSGYGNHLSQATANVRPVFKDNKVRFFWATNTTTRMATIFNLATATTIARQNMSGGFVMEPPGGNVSAFIDLGLSEFAPYAGHSPDYRNMGYHDGGALNATTGKYTSRRCVVTWRHNGTNLIWNVNGVEQTMAAESAVSMSRMRLGCFNGGGNKPMTVCEAVVFASDVGATDIAKLRTYLATKAGADDATKTVHVIGDSLSMSVGSELGKPWHDPDYVTNRSGSRWFAWAVDGGTIQSPAVTAANAVLSAGSTEAVYIVWLGTNDIKSNAQTGVNTESRIATYCTTLKASGRKVIVCTLQHLGAAVETQRAAFNAAVVANYTTYADGIVRLDLDAALDDCTDTTYFTSDQTHLKDAGYAVVGALIQTAMANLA